MTENLRKALAIGDPREVAALIEAGADIRYQADEGYDALIDAVHGRDILNDSRLIDLLNLLIANGASLRGMSAYGESGVRVLSRLGRFDAVRLLLDSGANPGDVGFTKLIEIVVFGSQADLEAALQSNPNLEERDFWERTPWLFAIQMGDIPKAKTLLEHGAQRDAKGRCGRPPLFYAAVSNQAPMLRWLLEIGLAVDQTDDFDCTALAEASQNSSLEAVNALVSAGADVNRKFPSGSVLRYAETREIAMTLLAAGADPLEMSSEGRRAILGYSPEPDAELLNVSAEEFRQYRSRRFGTRNPEMMNNPFWEGMIRSGLTAYQGLARIVGDSEYGNACDPVWCADRFGQSLTFLPDGRIVQVAGEHEDGCDPDFCIYNDVFVHHPDGSVIIYGYPESVFPPTDFHTATLMDDSIYLIGSLGYGGARQYGATPVYRLDTETFQITRIETAGDNPGWISKHRATRLSANEIQVAGGKIASNSHDEEKYDDNAGIFVLNIETQVWAAQGGII